MYKNLQDFVETPSARRNPCRVSTIIDGLSRVLPDHEVAISRDPTDKVVFRLGLSNDPIGLVQLTWTELRSILNKVMLAYFLADYKRIKEHLLFRHVFHYAERGILFMEDGKQVARVLGSFPCLRCGIILPEDQITIDHHHPQNGGELLALLKVFRACHLTQALPSGTLGNFYAEHSKDSSEQLAVRIMDRESWPRAVFPFSRVAPAVPFRGTTLNDLGTLVYSVLIWSDDIQRVIRNCMDSLLNLKPLCLRCNSSKGNVI